MNNKTEKEIAFYIGNSLIIYVWNQCFTFIGKLSASVPLLIIIYHCICFMLGVNYNIPLCVLLQEDHPLVPPLVYVRPTNSMVIVPSQHVDTEGRVYHPYLNQWDSVNVCSS